MAIQKFWLRESFKYYMLWQRYRHVKSYPYNNLGFKRCHYLCSKETVAECLNYHIPYLNLLAQLRKIKTHRRHRAGVLSHRVCKFPRTSETSPKLDATEFRYKVLWIGIPRVCLKRTWLDRPDAVWNVHSLILFKEDSHKRSRWGICFKDS